MNQETVRRVLRESAGLRVGTHTAGYVVAQLRDGQAQKGFFVMGGDARTGRPVRQKLTAAMLVELSSSPE